MKFLIRRFWLLILIGTIGLSAATWRVWNGYMPTSKAAREKIAANNRELNNAKLIGSEWLKQGTWLVNAWPMQPSSADLQFSPEGALITGGRDEGSARKVLLWDARTGKVKAKYDKRKLLANVVLPFTTEYLTFSPDEKSIAAGGLVILPISNLTSPNNLK